MIYLEGRFVYGDDIYVDDYHMDEEWEPINGFPDYSISSKGRVWSQKQHKFLKPKRLDGHGHIGFCLSNNNRRSYKYLARLIAEAFIPNPYGYPEVRHLNDNPLCNELDNLAWGTHRDNMRDCVRNGHAYFITDEDRERGFQKTRTPIKAIKLSTGEEFVFVGQGEAARQLGLNQSNIWKVLNGERTHTCGYSFRYAERRGLY